MRYRNYDCKEEGCNMPVLARGLCNTHYARLRRNGHTKLKLKKLGKYVAVKHNGQWTLEHLVMAEKALGRKIPWGVQVHHMNSNGRDNHSPFNLVICPNQLYHRLLHQRAKLPQFKDLFK